MKKTRNAKKKILVTAYESPDLDGAACAYAYAEFLRKKKADALAAISGKPHTEAVFAMNKFRIPKLQDADELFGKYRNVILVDASDLIGISRKLDPKKVREIIDHRKVHEADKFPNAKAQIEMVGSAATLIAEKFHQGKVPISRGSAGLLYSAIVSNTINFQVPITTERDKKMAAWLMKKAKINKNYVRQMFTHKSDIKDIGDAIMQDAAYFSFGGKEIAIAQLEILNAEAYVKKNINKIRNELENLKVSERKDFVFLNCIDVEKAKNIIVALDDQTAWLLASAANLAFHENVAKTEKILMRKQIVPMIKKFLEK